MACGPSLAKVEAKSAVGEGAEITCEQTCSVKVDADNVLTLAPGTIIAVARSSTRPSFPPCRRRNTARCCARD